MVVLAKKIAMGMLLDIGGVCNLKELVRVTRIVQALQLDAKLQISKYEQIQFQNHVFEVIKAYMCQQGHIKNEH